MNQEVQSQYDELDLMDLIKTLIKSWKLIAILFLITVAIVGSITYFYLPKKYLSKTIFYLEAEGRYASKYEKMNMVKEVIHSNQFLRDTLETAGSSITQDMVNAFRSSITIKETTAKNTEIQVIWDDPAKAYDILKLVYDRFKRETGNRIEVYVTNKLNVAEEQFNRTHEEFEKISAALADFQKKHNIFFIPPQLAISDQYYSEMKAQLADSPSTLIEYENLMVRQAAAKENYIKASDILEETRRSVADELNYTFVSIDPPLYPEKKHSPSTVLNMAIAGFLALFVGVLIAFFREYIRSYKEKENTITS